MSQWNACADRRWSGRWKGDGWALAKKGGGSSGGGPAWAKETEFKNRRTSTVLAMGGERNRWRRMTSRG